MNHARVEVTVTGIVQAVGFRPFVYRRATAHDLGGTVRNTGDAGVEIVLEGREADIEAFLSDLTERPPPLAVVENVTVSERQSVAANAGGGQPFEIAASTGADGGSGTIPPDTGICDACLADMRDVESRYHAYWATACVDCGPRYTVIESLPYDRPRTTMNEFPLCPACREEYEAPANRRYHAQTTACPACGPTLSLLDSAGRERVSGVDAITDTATILDEGGLVAIRGVGGTHLVCVATETDVVERLRDLTGRPAKPFAVMAPSLDVVETFATVTERERDLLTDVRRPILALEANRERASETDEEWLDVVAPGLHTVGVMLPYAGLHHLLFDHFERPLVMTSANLPGQPMATTVVTLYDDLGEIIDAALVHDREILARCDDSVLRLVDGDCRFLRRSRGWVPRPLPRRDDDPSVLALGAEFDAVVALARDDEVFPSQHLGDIDGPRTAQFLRETVDHLLELFGADPTVVACDSHPAFVTTRLANRFAEQEYYGIEHLERVQHHHAHAAGLLAEHGLDRSVVVTADGTGYGSDGTVWGGEVLDTRRESFDRVGGLDTFRLPGGEAAVRKPGRILASLLEDRPGLDSLLADATSLDETERKLLRQSLTAGTNAPRTTSAGRFLDAVSALLGICTHRRYQGEPALRLEAAATGTEPLEISIPYTKRGDQQVVDVRELIHQLDELHQEYPPARVAATAQTALGCGLATLAVNAAEDSGVETVGFTGGVAYNDAISRTVRETVETAGLTYVSPEQVPPGDAGIAYGQAIVATARRS